MFDTKYRMLGAGARGWSREMLWGGRLEGDSGLRARIHPWWIHVNLWQNQYSIVKWNKVKIKFKKKKERKFWHILTHGWTLGTLCWVKQAIHEKTTLLWFHSCEILRVIKITETEGGMVVAMGEGMGSSCLRVHSLNFTRWRVMEMDRGNGCTTF